MQLKYGEHRGQVMRGSKEDITIYFLCGQRSVCISVYMFVYIHFSHVNRLYLVKKLSSNGSIQLFYNSLNLQLQEYHYESTLINCIKLRDNTL